MKKMKLADVSLSALILGVIMIMILPMPTWMMDTLLILNITISVFILLASLTIKETLEFSVLPTLLLLTTVFRLALNLSSTKLILGNAGNAGKVIQTFGNFVIGGNLIVGVVVFIIIVAIQFVVITKGAERVSEVAARFTLDAMPGKQMAIDADLNTGAIDEATARKRRATIQQEADFYGAMDGASKFIKGDAIISIIITLVNIIGGLIIGVLVNKMALTDAINVYTLATVGDGLVEQIPALLISTSTGIIVTRSDSGTSFGTQLSKQILGNPNTMVLSGYVLLVMGLIPGFPKVQVYAIAAVLLFFGFRLQKKEGAAKKTPPAEKPEEKAAAEKRKPENVLGLLQVEQMELEFGYGLLPMIDRSLGGDLLDRIVMIRRQCAMDLGIVIPSIRLRDNVRLGTNEYVLKIQGEEVARGEVLTDRYLAINSEGGKETISGIETVEPTFGLPALWITKKQREKAEMLGYTTIDPPSVITTHLVEVIKHHAFELVDRQQTQMLVENLSKQQPMLVEEVVPKLFSYGEVQKILVGLLRENVPVKNLTVILETMADNPQLGHDMDAMLEKVRQSLSRVITARFLTGDDPGIAALDPGMEQMIAENTRKTENGRMTILDPTQLKRLLSSTKNAVEQITMQGKHPVILTSPVIRQNFKRLISMSLPDVTVLSYAEVEQNYELHITDMIGKEQTA